MRDIMSELSATESLGSGTLLDQSTVHGSAKTFAPGYVNAAGKGSVKQQQEQN